MSSISALSAKLFLPEAIEDVDELDDKAFLKYFTELENALRMLQLESRVFIIYMQKLDSTYCQAVIDYLDNKSFVKSSMSVSSMGSGLSQASISSEIKRKKGSIATALKIEILINVMEDSQNYFNRTIKRGSYLNNLYIAEHEEAKITGSDISNAINTFEVSVVEKGFDPLTQRIPAEKFLRYMDEWTKMSQIIIQKLLLHNNNEKILLNKLKVNLVNKRELGANIHAVDFDQLNIQNKNLKTKIENTLKYVKELKKLNGASNLVLTQYKNHLQREMKDAVILKAAVKEQREYIEILKTQCSEVAAQVEEEKENYYSFKDMKLKYEVPPVLEYVETKAKLYEKYKKLKIAERRNKILDIALNASTTQMKNLLRTTVVDPNWYRSKSAESLDMELV